MHHVTLPQSLPNHEVSLQGCSFFMATCIFEPSFIVHMGASLFSVSMYRQACGFFVEGVAVFIPQVFVFHQRWHIERLAHEC